MGRICQKICSSHGALMFGLLIKINRTSRLNDSDDFIRLMIPDKCLKRMMIMKTVAEPKVGG